jgi:hypothetical protein
MSFDVVEETPPTKKHSGSINWQERLDKIEHTERWYLIGAWGSKSNACGHLKRVKDSFPGFAFRAAVVSEDGIGSKLYAMRIKACTQTSSTTLLPVP